MRNFTLLFYLFLEIFYVFKDILESCIYCLATFLKNIIKILNLLSAMRTNSISTRRYIQC